MMGHNIHFKGVMWKNIIKLSLLPLHIWSTDDCVCVWGGGGVEGEREGQLGAKFALFANLCIFIYINVYI